MVERVISRYADKSSVDKWVQRESRVVPALTATITAALRRCSSPAEGGITEQNLGICHPEAPARNTQAAMNHKEKKGGARRSRSIASASPWDPLGRLAPAALFHQHLISDKYAVKSSGWVYSSQVSIIGGICFLLAVSK